ncbi:uncharacterized protein SAPINGB_P001117 [Magnusiomyces paraingens]|uniref:Phospho-2-dehydro-3-deoxyheptonate aldolase n=1 Tax=Magnusiomyces paraingens TaxID=2606893 RepID=A0A5E8B4N1_9ASCO|nr:uncharacterized protein SAPINGB_P001117 [Saprochaete ingens]VVT46243.1 unnamed protein product [Saprochaete ingens]
MEKTPKVIVSNPSKLEPSDGAKRAAKLRSTSNDMVAAGRPQNLGQLLPQVEEAVHQKRPEWTPTTWQDYPIKQDVVYDDETKVEAALEKLESLPPLVHPAEIERLKQKLSDAAEGKAFLLQGGDCAELFDYCNEDRIDSQLKVLLQMSLVLIWGSKLPVIRMGRMAGQYAKPRSKLTEMIDGNEIPSFRGDNINGFDIKSRTPDPARLVSSYFHAAATINHVRSQLANGFADLRRPLDWDLSHVQKDHVRERYQEVVDRITEGLAFMKTIGADKSADITSVDFFTAHEALLLEYEQTLTRNLRDPATNIKKWYNTSAHFVWIGDRTRQIDGAHVEFFRGLANPIGIKVGPSMEAKELVELLDIVDPNYETGRVTLITRYGGAKIRDLLPQHIKAVRASGHKVVWVSDPCHGNTKVSPVTKFKTRYFDDIATEIRLALEIHKECGSVLNGMHLELTGDAVTECIGGSQALEDKDLVIRYDTVCDPRLSVSQSLDIAFLVSDWFQGNKQTEV